MGLSTAVVGLLFNQWTLALAVVGVAFKIWYKSTTGICRSKRRLDGLTALVTGANTGIGLETARDLARRGARVLLACRDPERGQRALELVRAAATGGASVELLSLDLESLASVRACAAKVVATEPRLDILVNNAAAAGLGSTPSRDGLHRILQVNYLGPFLFTLLLVDLLKKSAPSRIVIVASIAHLFADIKPELLDHTRAAKISGPKIYNISKMGNVMQSNELARRLKGTGVTVNCLHPGAVLTDFIRCFPRLLIPISRMGLRVFFKSAEEGAQTTIHLAVSEELEGVTGRYFCDCKEAPMAPQAYDEALARAVWEKSEQLVKLSDQERPSFASCDVNLDALNDEAFRGHVNSVQKTMG